MSPPLPCSWTRPWRSPDFGPLRVDLAYGGMIYAIADAAALGLRLTPDEARDITRVGERIKVAAREQMPQAHPEHPEVVGPTIVCLVGPPSGPHADQRNAVVVSTGTLDWSRPDTWTGALDRSPCGTATCARMAVLHARGALAIGRDFRNEGVLGTVFTGRLVAETEVAGQRAVIPTIIRNGLGHRVTPAMCSTRTTLSRPASPWPTFGAPAPANCPRDPRTDG